MATTGYSSDLSTAQWALIEPHILLAKPDGRPRRTEMYAVANAIFYLFRTGCQWRLLPKDFPPWGTVWWYFRCWRKEGAGFDFTERFILSSGLRPGAGRSRAL